MKIPVTRFGICTYCARRATCKAFDVKRFECVKTEVRDDTCKRAFRKDGAALAEIDRMHKAEAEEFLGRLKRTDRSQVNYSRGFSIEYSPKPIDVRERNSRNWKKVNRVTEDGDFVKWCENCGAKFSTFTPERLLCDECHDEICEFLGVDYGMASRHGGAKHRFEFVG